MAGEIRRAVIQRIARERRVSRAVASFIYSCMSIKRREALCKKESAERERRAREGE